MDSKNERLFGFYFDAAFFQNIFSCFFLMLITDNVFLFMAPLITTPIYVNLRPNVDAVCFQRTKGLLWL